MILNTKNTESIIFRLITNELLYNQVHQWKIQLFQELFEIIFLLLPIRIQFLIMMKEVIVKKLDDYLYHLPNHIRSNFFSLTKNLHLVMTYSIPDNFLFLIFPNEALNFIQIIWILYNFSESQVFRLQDLTIYSNNEYWYFVFFYSFSSNRNVVKFYNVFHEIEGLPFKIFLFYCWEV